MKTVKMALAALVLFGALGAASYAAAAADCCATAEACCKGGACCRMQQAR